MQGENVIQTANIQTYQFGNYQRPGIEFTNVSAGSYTLNAVNIADTNGFTYIFNSNPQSLTVADQDITNNTGYRLKTVSGVGSAIFTLINRDTTAMHITSREEKETSEDVTVVRTVYDTTYDVTVIPVKNAKLTISVEGEDPVVITSDANGKTTANPFIIYAGKEYKISVVADGYKTFEATIFKAEGVTFSATETRPTYELFKEAVYTGETVKLSGEVTMDGTDQNIPEGLKIGIRVDDEYNYAAAIEKNEETGKYTYSSDVAKGQAKLHVLETINNVDRDAYEYRIKSPIEAFEIGRFTEEERMVVIERFATTVTCAFTGMLGSQIGKAYLLKDGEKIDSVNISMNSTTKEYKVVFRGVLPGTYTLTGSVRAYEPKEAVEVVVAETLEPMEKTVEMEPGIIDLTFTPMPNREDSALYGYNKYLGSVVYMNGAKLELWNEAKDQKLAESVVSVDDFTLKTRGKLGDKFVVKMSREDIYPTETTVTVTNVGFNNYSFKGLIRFVPVAHAALEFKAVWNDATKATLTWEWPEAEKMEDLVIAKIELRRRTKANNEWTVVTTWEAPAMDALPTTFNDTEVAKGNQYVYEFKITYSTPEDIKTTTCEMDARFRYKLEFSVNDEKMGSITGGQPGNYLENTQIELTALPNPNYEFVAWKSGDDTVAKTATILFNISQDTSLVAIFKNKAFKISVLSDNSEWGTVEGEGSFEFGTEVTVTATPAKGYKFVAWKENTVEVSKEAAYKFTVEKDRTLIAVFEEEVANEDLEASRWAIFAENGTLVINGLDGDRYTVYDLNGRLAGQALCTGTEIRMTVNPNQLYIVRRVSAQGAFGFKKIVVR